MFQTTNQLRYFWASLSTWSIQPSSACPCRDAPGDVRFQGPKSRQSPGAPATDFPVHFGQEKSTEHMGRSWKLDGNGYLENTHLKLWKTTGLYQANDFWWWSPGRTCFIVFGTFWHPLCSSNESVCHKHRSLLLRFALCICAWQHIHECIASSEKHRETL